MPVGWKHSHYWMQQEEAPIEITGVLTLTAMVRSFLVNAGERGGISLTALGLTGRPLEGMHRSFTLNAESREVFRLFESLALQWLLRDDFDDTLPAGSVDGTPATPGPGIRSVNDTGNHLSISSGSVRTDGSGVGWGNPRVVYSNVPLSRVGGRVLVFQFDQDPVFTSFNSYVGFVRSTTPFAFDYSLGVGMIEGGYPWTSGYGYTIRHQLRSERPAKRVIVLREQGFFHFMYDETRDRWELIWFDSVRTDTPVYIAFVHSHAGQVKSIPFIRVPEDLWLPAPRASDSFDRSDGVLGVTDGQGHLEANGGANLTWNGSTFTVSGNTAINTPTLSGTEDLADNDMEAVGVASWDDYGTPTTKEKSGVQVHGGLQSLHVITDLSNEGVKQDMDAPDGPGWGEISAWLYVVTTACEIGDGYSWVDARSTTAGVWRQVRAHTWVAGGSHVRFRPRGAPGEVYVDDTSCKTFDQKTLFATIDSGSPDVILQAKVTVSGYTSAGVVLCLDDPDNPQNYIVARIDNALDNSLPVGIMYCQLVKVVGGVLTSLVREQVSVTAGGSLTVVKDGTFVQVFYNNVLVGANQTISDAGIISNTRHGLFSTDPQNTLDNFQCWGVSEPMYQIVDKWL